MSSKPWEKPKLYFSHWTLSRDSAVSGKLRCPFLQAWKVWADSSLLLDLALAFLLPLEESTMSNAGNIKEAFLKLTPFLIKWQLNYPISLAGAEGQALELASQTARIGKPESFWIIMFWVGFRTIYNFVLCNSIGSKIPTHTKKIYLMHTSFLESIFI